MCSAKVFSLLQAFITYNGSLTSRFQYIDGLRHSKKDSQQSSKALKDLMTS